MNPNEGFNKSTVLQSVSASKRAIQFNNTGLASTSPNIAEKPIKLFSENKQAHVCICLVRNWRERVGGGGLEGQELAGPQSERLAHLFQL